MSNRHWRQSRAFLFLISVLAAHSASALEYHLAGERLRLDITESAWINYHADDGSADPSNKNYVEFINRLNVQLAGGRLLAGMRVDTSDYARIYRSSPPDSDPNITSLNRFEQHPLVVHQVFLTYADRNVEATAGDAYVNFGRGLILSIRKIDELGVDTTLRGGKVLVHTGNFNAVGVAGFSYIQNIDETTSSFTQNPHDFLGGLHLDYRFAGKLALGAHVVGSNADVLNDGNNSHARYGFVIDANRVLPWLQAYLEYIADKDDGADALYATSTIYAGRATLLFEFKDYRNYRRWRAVVDPSRPVWSSLVYQQPPTLERIVTQLTSNTDVAAGRARVDVRITPSAQLFGSVEYGSLNLLPDSPADRLVDAYVGTELHWNQGSSHFFPLLGYRREVTASSKLEEELVATEIDFAQLLSHRNNLSLEVQGLHWWRQKPASQVGPWEEGNIYVALKWAPRLIFALGYEFTTERKFEHQQHDFGNGSITWNITSSTSLVLFGGGRRPGLKCVSGVCRVFPAFQGARLEFVIRL